MKRYKCTTVFITIVLIAAMMTIGVSAAGTAQLLDTDKTTGGNWVGNYGSEGYIIITDDNSLQSIPSYAKLDYSNENENTPDFWTWYDSEGGFEDVATDELERRLPAAPFKSADKKFQLAACYYSGEFFTITADIGSETKIATIYMMDYDEGARESAVTVYDESGKELIAPIEVFGYEGGWYLKFKISGKVQFMFEKIGGPNVVVSGIFFDPDPNAVVATPEPVSAPAENPASESAPPAPVEISAPAPAPQVPAPQTGDAAAAMIVVALFASITAIGVSRAKKLTFFPVEKK